MDEMTLLLTLFIKNRSLNLKINNLRSKYIIQKFNLNFQCDIR